MPAAKGLEAGRSVGLHDVPGGAARGGPAFSFRVLDAEASFDSLSSRFISDIPSVTPEGNTLRPVILSRLLFVWLSGCSSPSARSFEARPLTRHRQSAGSARACEITTDMSRYIPMRGMYLDQES